MKEGSKGYLVGVFFSGIMALLGGLLDIPPMILPLSLFLTVLFILLTEGQKNENNTP